MTATTTTNPKTTAALEKELAAICRRLEATAELQDRRVHLFIDLRTAGVTQARIGEVAGMSDVGVVLAIKRHLARQAKAEAKLSEARDDTERAEATAELCPFCTPSPEAES